MKKKIFTALIIVTMSVFYVTDSLTHQTGAPARRTGAPGENTCVESECHSSNSLNSGGGAVAISVQDGGGDVNVYTPNADYTVMVNLTAATSQTGEIVGGFEVTAVGDNGAFQGSFTLPPDLKVVNGIVSGKIRQYATHTNPASFFPGSGQQWSFGWTAPASDVGKITFYAAANSANGDATPLNDFIYTTAKVLPNILNVRETKNTHGLKVFPTVTSGSFHVQFQLPQQENITISLVDMQGKIVKELEQGSFTTGNHVRSYNASELNAGVYLVKISSGTDVSQQKMFIQ